jgi:hypothetical protein
MGTRAKRLEYLALPLTFALGAFSLLMLTANNYGIFTDELYFFACVQHLDFGYVDHPPFIAWITRLSMVFGQSLFTLRLFPALACAGSVVITALIARALGGKWFAVSLASLSILCGTVFWVMFSYVSPNAYDILFITLVSYLVILILQKESGSLWIALGVVVGVGMNTKYTMIVFAFGLVVGILLTSQRRMLRTRYPYIAAVIALAMFIPHVLWQVFNDWPTREFIHNAAAKNLNLSLFAILRQLVFAANPLLFPLWGIGLIELARRATPASMRPLAIAIVVFGGVYFMNHLKFYYFLPILPLLLAAGSVALERWIDTGRRGWWRTAVVVPIVLLGVATLPFGLPMLPVDLFVSYARMWGLEEKIQMEHSDAKTIPGYFGQRIGWADFAQSVASVYHAIPDSDRAECGILGFHYGEAGAIDYFGPALGLPKAIGRHMSYWLWGPRQYSGKILIVMVSGKARIEPYFRSATLCATYEFPYVDDENRVKRIYLCRDSKEPLPTLWQRLKEYK